MRERVGVPLIVGIMGVLAALGFNALHGHGSTVRLDSSQRPSTTAGVDAAAGGGNTPSETTTTVFDIFNVTQVAQPASSQSQGGSGKTDHTATSRDKQKPDHTTSSHDPNTTPTSSYGTAVNCARDPYNPACGNYDTSPPTTTKKRTTTTDPNSEPDTTDTTDPNPF